MKSTAKIHEIVGNMPEEDRKEMMLDLKELRELVTKEVTMIIGNPKKLLKLLYHD